MPKGYWIVHIDVNDPEGYKSYLAGTVEAHHKFGGTALVRGGQREAVEGRARSRNVLREFSDYAAALACYRSPEYQRAKPLRLNNATSEFVIIEGYDGAQPPAADAPPAQAARKGYWIAHADVSDPDGYKAYIAANAMPFSKFGGRFLVRGGTREVVEGAVRGRTVVLEFPSYEAALACYRSADYQAVVQIILRKDLAPNFNPKAPLNERVKLLKDRTIAVDAIGSILHGYPLMLAKRAGLDPKSDLRISPMAPLAALAAFKTRQIDGFAMSMPWPIGPVLDDEAVLIASGPDGDPPDMVPFGMASLITRPETCEKRKSICEAMGRAITEAANFIRNNPAEAMAVLKKRFATLDDKVFAAGFDNIRKSTPARPVMVRAAMENGERYNIEAGLLPPDARLKSYDGLYTEAFVP